MKTAPFDIADRFFVEDAPTTDVGVVVHTDGDGIAAAEGGEFLQHVQEGRRIAVEARAVEERHVPGDVAGAREVTIDTARRANREDVESGAEGDLAGRAEQRSEDGPAAGDDTGAERLRVVDPPRTGRVPVRGREQPDFAVVGVPGGADEPGAAVAGAGAGLVGGGDGVDEAATWAAAGVPQPARAVRMRTGAIAMAGRMAAVLLGWPPSFPAARCAVVIGRRSDGDRSLIRRGWGRIAAPAPRAGTSPLLYRFEGFAFDPAESRLMRGAETLTVQPKVLDALRLFVERPGRLLSKQELMDGLWPGLYVGEESLTQVIRKLRLALGDDPQAPSFVETVPRRGYRFLPTVVAGPDETAPPPPARCRGRAAAATGRRELAAAGCWPAPPLPSPLPPLSLSSGRRHLPAKRGPPRRRTRSAGTGGSPARPAARPTRRSLPTGVAMPSCCAPRARPTTTST